MDEPRTSSGVRTRSGSVPVLLLAIRLIGTADPRPDQPADAGSAPVPSDRTRKTAGLT